MREEKLNTVRQHELEIFQEFDRLCTQNGLKYYVIAGTLLGAVRHKGFIPWDDDIDVAMPRKDYERLGEICRRELGEAFFFQSVDTDPDYPYLFNRLRKNGTEVDELAFRRITMHKGVYIDIFPLDGCPAKDWSGKLFFKWVEQLHCAVMAAANPDFVCGYKKCYMRALHGVLRRLPRPVRFALWNMTWSVVNALCKKKLCTVCGRHGYPAESYQAVWFDETVQLEFEGRMLPAPAGWDAMLTNLYGDYMTPPSEEERKGHFE